MTTMIALQTGHMEPDRRDQAMEDVPNTPTTPRAPQHSTSQAREITPGAFSHSQATPGSLQGQKPLPSDPFPGSGINDHREDGMERGGSHRSTASSHPDSMELDSGDEHAGSGDEQDGGESTKGSKKKKGQRFFCTDFPPCNLSFTRSEHLARHIRKHTGERPFQCHCNRRFSRLDNLRQHAQTVHVNEDIPGDSLAATGTRFQRQIRTDRVRPPGGRARSGTAGSQGGHSRGHSRNLSTSSIGSTASSFSLAPEPRRRPPPLIMANDNSRSRTGVDSSSPPTTPTSQYAAYSAESPGGFSTPTSTAYSTGPGSPNFSNYGSPARSGLFTGPAPARRLSVPSGASPFISPYGHSHQPQYMSPIAPSNTSRSNASSVYASPTSSHFSFARGDPNLNADAEWRRRTWHPTSYNYSGNLNSYGRPATSGLSYSQTPDAPQPAFAPNATTAAGPAPRLPGIESFDHVQHRPTTPPRRQLSPIHTEGLSLRPAFSPAAPPPHVPVMQSHPNGPDHRRNHVSWDLGLHSNLKQLDLGGPHKDATQWGQQTLNEIQEAASRPSQARQPSSKDHTYAPYPPSQRGSDSAGHLDGEATTPQRNKRLGWYNGPPSAGIQQSHISRKSPEDSSSSEGVPTPGTSTAEYHPAIVHSNGYIEPHQPPISTDGTPMQCAPQPPSATSYGTQVDQPRNGYYEASRRPQHDLGRLEALVAVATSEDTAASTVR